MATPPPPAPGNPYGGNPYTQQPNPYGPPAAVPPQQQPPYPQPAYPQQPNGQQPYGQPQGYPPAQGYPPQHGYAAPQGYAQPPQGYAPPQQQPQQFQKPPQQPQSPYGYPQQQDAAPQYGYPQVQHQPVYDGGPTCRFCGGFPAAAVNFHGHRGMVFVMQFLKTSGPFCLTCGTAVMRDMSAKTMVRGWWGYGSWIFSSIALIRNAVAFNKVKVLPPAAPAPGMQQLSPGAPLSKRPEALGLLVPVGLVLFFLICLVVIAAGN